MPLHREKVHDALDRLIRVVRVEGADAEVSGFRKCDRGFHRFRVPDFTDEDHVRRLPQRISEGALKGEGVKAHFPLRNDRALMVVDELDGIFHRDDMAWMGGIAVVDHGGEGGGFS